MARICIVSPDMPGVIKNGGIGTACFHQSAVLAEAGHEVTALFTAESPEIDPADQQRAERLFAEAGVEFAALTCRTGGGGDPPHPIFPASPAMSLSVAVDQWLRAHRFDVVLFMDWKHIGLVAIEARRAGTAHHRTAFVLVAHSPTLWHLLGQHEPPGAWIPNLLTFAAERRAIAGADLLISPSAYLIDWMLERRWQLPESRLVIQNPFRAALRAGMAGDRPAPPQPVTELVFFGRLERRKGLALFLSALDQLVASGHRPGVTFLGKPGHVGERAALDLIVEKMPPLLSVHFLTDLDSRQAIQYLRGEGRLAVIASQVDNSPYTVTECLMHGIPLVAAEIGGIPELIVEADHARCLFAPRPDALVRRLTRALAEGQAPARFACPPEETASRFVQTIESLARSVAAPAAATPEDRPLVSVCITHYERPQLIDQALASIEAQRYAPIETILVDDGSRSAEARQKLDALEARLAARGGRLIRAGNRYPGAARNTAFAAASGKYILFMDDDNVAMAEEIAILVRAAERTGADLVSCGFYVFDSPLPPTDATAIIERYVPIGSGLAFSLINNILGDTNALIRAETFAELGGYSEDYGVGYEDIELYTRLVLAGKRIATVPDPLFWYRRGDSSVQTGTPIDANRTRHLRAFERSLPAELSEIVYLAEAGVDRSPLRPASINPFELLDPLVPEAWLDAPRGDPSAPDSLIRAARLAALRGNRKMAASLKQALGARAPVSPGTLDALALLMAGPEMSAARLSRVMDSLALLTPDHEPIREAILSVARIALLNGFALDIPEPEGDPEISLLHAIRRIRQSDFRAAEDFIIRFLMAGTGDYLAIRTDVAQGIAGGWPVPGLRHFIESGHREGTRWPNGRRIIRLICALGEPERRRWLDSADSLVPLLCFQLGEGELIARAAATHAALCGQTCLTGLVQLALDGAQASLSEPEHLDLKRRVRLILGTVPDHRPSLSGERLDRLVAAMGERCVRIEQADAAADPDRAELSEEEQERLYLEANPDVRRAVERGVFASGADHFRKFGRREGRSWRRYR